MLLSIKLKYTIISDDWYQFHFCTITCIKVNRGVSFFWPTVHKWKQRGADVTKITELAKINRYKDIETYILKEGVAG